LVDKLVVERDVRMAVKLVVSTAAKTVATWVQQMVALKAVLKVA
jgi:hypothetical protein